MKKSVSVALAMLLLGATLAPLAGGVQTSDKKAETGNALDTPFYPLKVGTTWEYQSGGKKVVIKVSAHEKIDDLLCARIDTEGTGQGAIMEHVTVKPDGIYRVRSNNQEIKPHLLLLKLPPTTGDSWTLDSQVQNFGIKGKLTVGEEKLVVGKAEYATFTVKSSDFAMDRQNVTLETWYAKDFGIVKQHVKLPSADIDVVLELAKFTPGK